MCGPLLGPYGLIPPSEASSLSPPRRTLGISWPVAVLPRPDDRRRRRQNQVMAPITAAANPITPTATPALAPAERPPLCSTVMPEPVGAAAVEAVHAALDETTAHAYPAPQHPPPLHRTWPCAVHPDARGVTSVGVVVSVELVLELELVARQIPPPVASSPQSCVKAQQLPPSVEAQA